MSERAELQRLLQELLLGIQETLGSGERLSDSFQGLLAETINNLTLRIDQLSAEEANPPTIGQTAIPAGADLLWILSGGNPNAFVNYLRTYPGAGLQSLASNPARLEQAIGYLQQNFPIGIPGESQGVPDASLQSSNVAGMKYDPRSQRLWVRFHGEGHEPVYQYEGVPPMIYQILEHGNAFAQTKGKNKWGEWWVNKNPSLGAALNQYIKAGGYSYQRIS